MSQTPKKKVFVTGSNGLLGQKITDLVLATGRVELVATSRGANRHPVKTGYAYEDVDLLDANRLAEAIARHQPDAIIHTAAMTNVDACETDPQSCQALNVDVVRTLAQLSEQHGIHLIHLSTDFVFDGEDGPYREEDAPNPLSLYGKSKLDSENVLRQSSCKWAVLRTIIVYGVTADMSRSNIVLWAKGALEKGNPLNIVNDQWRMPTLAEDLAEACLLTAIHGAEGIFHISGEDLFAINELVEAVADYWGLDKSLINEVSADTFTTAAPRPKRTGFVLDKAREVLGYTPRSFQEGLAIVDQQLKLR